MKLYNTYTNKLEDFKPINDKEITIYYCGPTVYNYIHIGNARPIIFFDSLKKHLEHKGLKVTLASNFTDVNEKILAKAKEEGLTEIELANKYIDAYLDDVRRLNADDTYIKPRVTETIPEIIEFVDELVKKDKAYVRGSDVYFRVNSVKNYGALSNRKTDELIQGARIGVREEKESGLDFALWKEFHEGKNYESPWGEGRPGWHTECCVMINKLFNGMIDIHGGGTDLIFPHHENEIAQAEACYNHHIANYWVHTARVNFGSEKMSKSLGNVIWVKDLTCNPRAYRLLVLSFPYRNIINYTEDLQNQFNKEYDKIDQAMSKLHLYLDVNNLFDDEAKTNETDELLKKFDDFNDDDFNSPNGLTVIYDCIKLVNLELRGDKDKVKLNALYNVLSTMLHVYGLDKPIKRMSDEDKDIYNKWMDARNNKDFEKADVLRQELLKRGII